MMHAIKLTNLLRTLTNFCNVICKQFWIHVKNLFIGLRPDYVMTICINSEFSGWLLRQITHRQW